MVEDLLERLPLFQGLDAAQINILRPLFSICKEEAGVVVFEQGAPADYLYIVVEGEMSIRYKPEDGAAIARIRPNGVVGWSAALSSPTYTSAVICLKDSFLLRVSSRDMRELCDHYPETGRVFLERLAAVVAERETHAHPHVVALLELGLRVDHR
jgi:NTE family protein